MYKKCWSSCVLHCNFKTVHMCDLDLTHAAQNVIDLQFSLESFLIYFRFPLSLFCFRRHFFATPLNFYGMFDLRGGVMNYMSNPKY